MLWAMTKHAWASPFSAALRVHSCSFRLLRVTPRPRAWQMMLAASRVVIYLKSPQSKI